MQANTFTIGNPIVWDHSVIPYGTRIKDASPSELLALYPSLAGLLKEMSSALNPQHKHILVDVIKTKFSSGEASCVDTGWHLDGRTSGENCERYCIWADGDNRTLFSTKQIGYLGEIPVFTNLGDRRDFFRYALQQDLHDESDAIEIPACTPVFYDRYSFHKGRVAHKQGARCFIRVMSSDVIRPKRLRSRHNTIPTHRNM